MYLIGVFFSYFDVYVIMVLCKCVKSGRGNLVIDYLVMQKVFSCDSCGYIDSVYFPDGSRFDGEFKDNFISKTKFKKWTGTFIDVDGSKTGWKDGKVIWQKANRVKSQKEYGRWILLR